MNGRRGFAAAPGAMVLALLVVPGCAHGGASERGVDRMLPSRRGAFELVPGLLISPPSATAYIMTPARAVAAVDLASGEPRWITDAAAKPLLLDDGRLLAQVEPTARAAALELVWLDVQRSGEPSGRVRIALEGEPVPTIDEPPGAVATLRARRADGAVWVRWETSRLPLSGVRPDDGVRRTQGAARVAPGASVGVRVAPADLPPEPRPNVPPALTERALLRMRDVWAAVEPLDDVTRRGVVLQRWEAPGGQPLPAVVLTEDRFETTARSADARHVMVSRRADQGDDFVWAIHAADTGERVGELRQAVPSARFFVHRGDLVFEVPAHGVRGDGEWRTERRSLRAVELRTGRIRWTQVLRETTHRGPLPPAS